MLELKSDQVIEQLKGMGVSIYNASTGNDGVDAIFDSEHYKEFIRLIDELKIPVVFIEIFKLEDYEIEYSLIEDKDIRVYYAREVIKKEIEAFNRKVNKLKKYIGQEQLIKLFFFYQGVRYVYKWENIELYPDDKDEFIEELLERYEIEIEAAEEKTREEYRNQIDQYLAKLKNILMTDEQFKKCKNKDLRIGYIYKALRENEELKNVNDVPARLIKDTVEETWRELKLQNIL